MLKNVGNIKKERRGVFRLLRRVLMEILQLLEPSLKLRLMQC
jgi:hypothetical protein